MDNQINCPGPNPELYLKIIKRLRREKRTAAFWRTAIFLPLAAISAIFIFYGGFLMLRALKQSDAAQIISLIFSDSQIVLAYWQNYALAILEAVPLLPIIYLLLACLAFLLFLKNGLLNLQKFKRGY